ncbi:MCE family protein [Nocardioides carbamazepini]|uniref:MCE family protein n=1 Tax=Nocardioides carbamazepini TaxID=2854259 RepID=UPI00214A65EF|nr:MCE family protein [Nocardioides carbamazepini]MCR1786508.1 MCE family protein [Nocardioides carbamazepini]
MSTRPTTRPPRSARRWAAVTGALAFVLSGCGLGGGIYDVPLPGGADVGNDPMTITVDFTDVVDLVPQSSVKVSNIAVGRVSDIELNPDGLSARVTLVVRNDLDLPENTGARLQQSSLLGEKYIALVRPSTPAGGGELRTGSHIGLAATSQVAEVEQVLGAVSTVLNGGAVGKFQEISRELQKVAEGRPEQIRDFLRTTRVFVESLDARKDAIASALDSLADLSATLDDDKDKIATALEGLSPGMKVLAEQRPQLVAMLTSLDQLSTVTMRTLDASKEDMIEDFRLLEPILKNLAAAGDALPESLQILLTYPFPDAVLGTIKGDYLNAFVTTNYSSLPPGCAAMGCPWSQPGFDLTGIASGGPAQAQRHSSSASTPPATEGTPAATESPSGTPSSSPTSGASPSPSLLPPTDSPIPGIPAPTLQVPKPTGTPSPSGPTGAPSSTPTTTED